MFSLAYFFMYPQYSCHSFSFNAFWYEKLSESIDLILTVNADRWIYPNVLSLSKTPRMSEIF